MDEPGARSGTWHAARVDRRTQLALNAINQAFYASIAPEWSATRKTPWPGFARVAARLPPLASAADSVRVLDVGAGDGRFAQYLQGSARSGLDYCGIDASAALLAHARARALGSGFRFLHGDFIREPLAQVLPDAHYDLVALLGVLHHVPGADTRHALLHALGARVSERGILALTFWRLPDDPRFASRVIPIAQHNLTADVPLRASELEPGDTLLRWGAGPNPPQRYCHFPSVTETDSLLRATSLRVIERFRADGRGAQLNEYVLLAR
jgi:SAM-dependent methyltransferase